MIHRTVHELLPLYALAALERGEQHQVELHLLGCAACRHELSGYSRVAEALGAEMEPGPMVWSRIQAAIESP